MNTPIQIFNQKNIDLFYLSPYVDYLPNKDKLVLRNDLFDTIVIAPPVKGELEEMLKELKKGIEPTEMKGFIEKNFETENPQKIIDGFIQNGIIE